MKLLLGKDYNNYCKTLDQQYINSIRCNTIKIQPQELIKKLKTKLWKIKQPFKENPEIIIIENKLKPGELGKSQEHKKGCFYIQEISSMMPAIALDIDNNNYVLDIAAAPGSKTTQIAAIMKNKGTILANDADLQRTKILAMNLQRCGVTNTITTQHKGKELCNKLQQLNFKFDKILVDAPCSGEGIIRTSTQKNIVFSKGLIEKFSNIQKRLLKNAFKVLKPNGTLIYSTCTYAPEENEEVIEYILKKEKNKIKIEKIQLPLKTRPGITKWQNKTYNNQVKNCIRIYPQDNNTEGFFIAKLKKIKIT